MPTPEIYPPLECARLAVEALSSLAKRTDPDWYDRGQGFRYPSDVYATLSELDQVLRLVPDVLAHAAVFLGRQAAAGHVSVDNFLSAERSLALVHQLAGWLDEASDQIAEARALAESARQVASTLGWVVS